MAKKNKNAVPGMEEEKSGGRAKTFFITLAIILFWLILLIVLIKMNVGGFGRKVLRPILKDVPVVNKILPAADEAELEEESGMNLEAALAKIDELNKQIEALNTTEATASDADNASKDATIADLQKQVEQLKPFADSQAAFDQTKEDFYNEVIYNDQAPDPETYTQWYESMDPDTAAKLYKEVVGNQQEDAKIKALADTYSNMEGAAAAGILQNMSGDLDTVTAIMEQIKADKRSEILAAMDSAFAAKITKKLMPKG